MKAIPEDIADLKRAGYITLQVEPLKWHARGQDGCMDIWPVVKKFRSPHTYGKPVSYEKIEKVIDLMRHSILPYDRDTPEQAAAYLEYRDRLECVQFVIHNRLTCAKKPLAVKSRKSRRK